MVIKDIHNLSTIQLFHNHFASASIYSNNTNNNNNNNNNSNNNKNNKKANFSNS